MHRKQSSTLANAPTSTQRSPAVRRSHSLVGVTCLRVFLACMCLVSVSQITRAQQFGFAQPQVPNQGVLPPPTYPGAIPGTGQIPNSVPSSVPGAFPPPSVYATPAPQPVFGTPASPQSTTSNPQGTGVPSSGYPIQNTYPNDTGLYGGGAPVAFGQPNMVPQNQVAPPQAFIPAQSQSPSDSINGSIPYTQPAFPYEPSISLAQPSAPTYSPRIRDVPVDVFVQEGNTGRFMLGGSVNSDLGVAGNITLEERNFDLFNFPKRPGEMFNGAFRGGGQNFRLELVPGNQVQRYTINWTEPNLFGYSPFSLSVGGFFFTRFYRDWTEQRLGGRVALGYEVTPDLSLSTELRAEDVNMSNLRNNLVPALNRTAGSSDLYTGRVSLIHSTRDSPFMPTEGHYLEMIYDQGFGEFDFPRGQVNFSRYFLIRERADGTGRQTLTSAWRVGLSGSDTPVFENFFAGGFSTLRGFRFRGASPVESDIQVGGRFQFIGSLEYLFPITADDMVRMVAFCDYGTIEQDIEFNWRNFRVAPGLGFRVAMPALGPAPLAFDFAVPVQYAPGDQKQVFNFSVGVTR
ncbi:MAG: BamA/TamA family outer membrane protein [Planctomycetota bacterium]|nr:BamA/TamA family outer membrane protein [Planctomycetota bacterium]